MIRFVILGEIGSGKSYMAKLFGFPVFNADEQVSLLYKNNRLIFKKLIRILPKHISQFPISKTELSEAIKSDKRNLKKIIKIVHPAVRSKMKFFLKKNKNKRAVVLDIPLYLENKINLPNDVLVFIDAEKRKIQSKIKKRENYDPNLTSALRAVQLSTDIKKKYSDIIIKNDFNKKNAKKKIKTLLKKILI